MNKLNIILLSVILASLSTAAYAAKEACVYYQKVSPGNDGNAGGNIQMRIVHDIKGKGEGTEFDEKIHAGEYRCQSMSMFKRKDKLRVEIRSEGKGMAKCETFRQDTKKRPFIFIASVYKGKKGIDCKFFTAKPAAKK